MSYQGFRGAYCSIPCPGKVGARVRAGRASVVGENGNARTATRSPPPRHRGIAEPPRRPHGLFSIPRAQALRIEKGEEWVLEDGELVLKR